VEITAGSREVPGRNACDRRHTYCIIIMSSNNRIAATLYSLGHSLFQEYKYKYPAKRR